MGINKFSDLTEEEFQALYASKPEQKSFGPIVGNRVHVPKRPHHDYVYERFQGDKKRFAA